MTLLERFDRCPPAFCLLVARKNRGRAAMTRRDLALVSGLGLRTIARYSGRVSWRGIALEDIQSFAAACGVNLLHPKKQIDWFRRRKRASWRGREKMVGRILGIIRQKRSAGPSAGR